MFGKNVRYSDGLWPYCKACDAKRAADYRAKDPEKARAIGRQSKRANPEKVAATKRKYRLNNPEKVKLARKAAYEKNRERELLLAAKYKAENKDAITLKAKEWLRNNTVVNRLNRSERRAIERTARPAWHDKTKVRELHAEAVRLESTTGNSWHVDHIVPLKSDLVCGLHWHGNMQLLPASENQSKSNRHWPGMP